MGRVFCFYFCTMNLETDTICAMATPPGVGAIGVIRVSGSDSIQIVSNLFSKDLSGAGSHTVHLGLLLHPESNEPIDEVLVTLFKSGKSYTGEESVEISHHGSGFIAKEILEVLMAGGCRMAAPGEFTQRAFANGKLDLSQAEAVADLIASETRKARDIALKQVRGGFSSELKELREKLIHFASLVELELDFAEEDVEFADRTELIALIEEVLNVISRLIQSFEVGNVIRNGVPVAIVGAPNTGKSTLLNQLLGEDRAIVSDIAGTTRDVIEEVLVIDGIQFRLMDTAGIREGAETIEAQGIERSKQKIDQATIVLCLADGSDEQSIQDATSWTSELKEQYPEKYILPVVNKSDLMTLNTEELSISAKNGEGIDALKQVLKKQVMGDFNLSDETIVSNARHLESLNGTHKALSAALNGLNTHVTGDFIAMDIRQASLQLGAITGDISTDDLLGNIFRNFCIGK